MGTGFPSRHQSKGVRAEITLDFWSHEAKAVFEQRRDSRLATTVRSRKLWIGLRTSLWIAVG